MDRRNRADMSKSIDAEIAERGKAISLGYLLGENEPGNVLHSFCNQVLEPNLMKVAFRERHGFDWDSPEAEPHQVEWARSWRDYRLSLDKAGVLHAAIRERASD